MRSYNYGWLTGQGEPFGQTNEGIYQRAMKMLDWQQVKVLNQ